MLRHATGKRVPARGALSPELARDLSAVTCFIDFDGTITTTDTGVYLLTRLTGDTWREAEDLYLEGVIGSRDSRSIQWSLLDSWPEDYIRSVAREVSIDPEFAPLVRDLRARGAEVTVISDGFGFYAQEVCGGLGVDLVTNEVDWPARRMTFPYQDRSCECAQCGTCKLGAIRRAAARGRTTVFIGDGMSDREAARAAGVLYAKSELSRWCRATGVSYRPFDTLGDVRLDLLAGGDDWKA